METIKAISTEEIDVQLKNVLNFHLFKTSPTLAKFLKFIVLETLQNKEHQIKEYSIAVNVMDRPSNFNPHDDAVVRIHAGRLRRALSEYYLTEGINDPVHIQIPKGAYIPQFSVMEKSSLQTSGISGNVSNTDCNPTVAIFPFKSISENADFEMFSMLLWEELSAELSRFQDMAVIGYYSAEMTVKINQNIVEAGKQAGADYIITGNIHYACGRMKVRVNLLITATGEIVMTQLLDNELLPDMQEVKERVITSVVSAVGGYYGYIFQNMEKASPVKVNSNPLIRKGIHSYHQYEREFSMENYHNAVSALEQAVKSDSGHALSMAMLGEIYLDAIPLMVKDIEDPIEKGYRCAMAAIKLDPQCQHAWHTLTWAYLIKKEKESCFYAGMQCINMNRNSSVTVAGAALMLISAGYFDEAFPVMDSAFKKNLYYPWWMNMGFIFYYLHKEDYAMAFSWADKMDAPGSFWDPMLKAATLAWLNEYAKAGKQLSKLLEIEPEAAKKAVEMIATYVLSEELIAIIITGLEKAGLNNK